ncbi:hypothetical protein H2200_003837 [Cladophialophora chaetospira]|uniref:SH3 domain-containing protein n=1 Tax=Cladophialophora chaetospira TaxID=386627 RepID=A0AA38XEY9_9EURO|nr:hypothetical protein H2200_003837 [Cladophialophora chaetospira]
MRSFGTDSLTQLFDSIIAVHGLGGDAFATWTHPKSKKFWLRDFLPQQIPDARIMTFGYNADAAFGQSTAEILDHAKSLLVSLVDKREEHGVVEKHSALLEINHEEQIPVDSDHSAMCKFETDDDDTFEKVYKRVKRMRLNTRRITNAKSESNKEGLIRSSHVEGADIATIDTALRSENKEGTRPKPDPTKLRVWTDRSGTFEVEAQFLGVYKDKIHLHKLNGVKIAVPYVKMSPEDLDYVEKTWKTPIDRNRGNRVVALYTYNAVGANELGLQVGDVITIIERQQDTFSWWKGQTQDGRIGLFPANYVKHLEL